MASKASKGFGVSCPFCGSGAPDANIAVDLNDLGVVTCDACSEEFTPDDAVGKLLDEVERWQRVARWVKVAREGA